MRSISLKPVAVTLHRSRLSSKYPRNYYRVDTTREKEDSLVSPFSRERRREREREIASGQISSSSNRSHCSLSLSLSLVIYQNNNLWLERKALKEKMERRGQGRRDSRLGWRITGIIYDDVEVGRKIATAKRDDPARRK